MHKKAFATTVLTVYLHHDNQPITDEHVLMEINFYDEFGLAGGGVIEYVPTGECWVYNDLASSNWTHWEVRFMDIFDWEVNGIDPEGDVSPRMEIWGGGAQIYLDWEAVMIPIHP